MCVCGGGWVGVRGEVRYGLSNLPSTKVYKFI